MQNRRGYVTRMTANRHTFRCWVYTTVICVMIRPGKSMIDAEVVVEDGSAWRVFTTTDGVRATIKGANNVSLEVRQHIQRGDDHNTGYGSV